MQRLQSFLLILSVILAVASQSHAIEAKSFWLTFDRKIKEGEKARWAIKLKSGLNHVVSEGGAVVKSERTVINADVTGTRVAREVRNDGKIGKFTFAVEQFDLQTGPDPAKPAFKPGTVIAGVLDAQNKPLYTVGADAIPPKTVEALEHLFPLVPEKHGLLMRGLNLVLGLDKPRAIGSSWPIDRKAFAEAFSIKTNIDFSPNDVAGIAKLASVKMHNGTEHCVLIVEITIKSGYATAPAPASKSPKVDGFFRMEFLIPTDPAIEIPYRKASSRLLARGLPGEKDNTTVEALETVEREEQILPQIK